MMFRLLFAMGLVFSVSLANAQNSDGAAFANGFVPTAPGQVVNPAAVNSQAWSGQTNLGTSNIAGTGAFTQPNTNSTQFSSGQHSGGLATFGNQAVASCANYVPTGNAAQDQYCAGVNFMSNKCIVPNANQKTVLGSAGVPASVPANCAGTYGASGANQFPIGVQDQSAASNMISAAKNNASVTSGCSVQTVQTAAAQYATYDCVANTYSATQTCSQSLATTVLTNKQTAITTYSCSGGTISGQYCVASTQAPAPVIYSCAAGQTLSGSNCINPNGSVVPASIASYGCPVGEVLSGSSCTNTSIKKEAATSSYSCPDGYTFNGGWCAQTVTLAATPSYSCSSSSNYISNGPTAPPTCQKVYERTLTACPSITQNFWGSGTPAYLVSEQFFGSCKVSFQGQVYYYMNWTCNGTDEQIFYGNEYVCQQIDPPTISSYSCTAPAVLVGSSCVTTTTSAATVIYSCNSGGTLSGSQCTYTTTSVSAATPNYSCPSGYSLSGTSCIGPSTIAATINYTCAVGSTLSGSGANSICTTVTATPATVNYSCVDGTAPQNGLCIIYSVTSAWQDNCTTYEASAGSKLGSPE